MLVTNWSPRPSARRGRWKEGESRADVLRENARPALLLSSISLPHRPQLHSFCTSAPSGTSRLAVPFLFHRQIQPRGVMTIKSKDCSQFASLSLRPVVHFSSAPLEGLLLHPARLFPVIVTHPCRWYSLPGFFSPKGRANQPKLINIL